jgi:hypothetical protein
MAYVSYWLVAPASLCHSLWRSRCVVQPVCVAETHAGCPTKPALGFARAAVFTVSPFCGRKHSLPVTGHEQPKMDGPPGGVVSLAVHDAAPDIKELSTSAKRGSSVALDGCGFVATY